MADRDILIGSLPAEWGNDFIIRNLNDDIADRAARRPYRQLMGWADLPLPDLSAPWFRGPMPDGTYVVRLVAAR